MSVYVWNKHARMNNCENPIFCLAIARKLTPICLRGEWNSNVMHYDKGKTPLSLPNIHLNIKFDFHKTGNWMIPVKSTSVWFNWKTTVTSTINSGFGLPIVCITWRLLELTLLVWTSGGETWISELSTWHSYFPIYSLLTHRYKKIQKWCSTLMIDWHWLWHQITAMPGSASGEATGFGLASFSIWVIMIAESPQK